MDEFFLLIIDLSEISASGRTIEVLPITIPIRMYVKHIEHSVKRAKYLI